MKKSLVLVFVFFLAITASVPAFGNTEIPKEEGELCSPADLNLGKETWHLYRFCSPKEQQGEAVLFCQYDEEGLPNYSCRAIESKEEPNFLEPCPEGQIHIRNFDFLDIPKDVMFYILSGERIPIEIQKDVMDAIPKIVPENFQLTDWLCATSLPSPEEEEIKN